MGLKRMDNVLLVVEDLDGAIAFFVELGMRLEQQPGPVEGPWVERVIDLQGVRQDVAVLRTPDGHGGLELVRFRSPEVIRPEPSVPPANTLGLRRIMFAVDDVDETVARLREHGAELVGTVEQYEDVYRLCYLRGPEGIVVGLAQELDGAGPG